MEPCIEPGSAGGHTAPRVRRCARHHIWNRAEHGQIVALFALVLVALISMAGLLVDGGMVYVQRRAAQTAADTGALAGARALQYTTDPVAAAKAIAATNGFPASTTDCSGATVAGVTVNSPPTSGPHSGTAGYVEVIVQEPMRTTFAAIVGQTCWMVSARGVAQEKVTTGYATVLADHAACGFQALSWTGSTKITGSVISNSGDQLSAPSPSSVSGAFTYTSVAGCTNTAVNSGGGGGITPSPSAVTTTTVYPVTYTLASFPCTYTFSGNANMGNGAWWSGGNSSSGVLLPGVYCAPSGDINLSAKATGQVTFVASGKITISSPSGSLTPFSQGVLGFTTSNANNAINLSASGGTWSGLLYAPNGQAVVSGSNNTYAGSIWADTVGLSGSNWNLTGAAAFQGTTWRGLVE